MLHKEVGEKEKIYDARFQHFKWKKSTWKWDLLQIRNNPRDNIIELHKG